MSVELSPSVTNFYQGGELPVHFIDGHNGITFEGTQALSLPVGWSDISPDDIRGKLEEINATHRILMCGAGKYAVEIAIVNASATTRTRIFCATARSGVARTPNNAYELALRALVDEDVRIIYVGAGKSGFGPEGDIPEAERRHLMKTGSLIEYESGQPRPLPMVRALQQALAREADVESPEEAYSESAGRVLNDALCIAFRGIQKVRRNGPLGVIDLSRIGLVRAYTAEGIRLAQNETNSPDPHKVTSRSERLALENMPNVYGIAEPKAQARSLASEAQVWAATRALSRGPAKGDPLLNDAMAVARLNPGVEFTYVVPELDLITGGEFQKERWEDIARKLSSIGAAAVRVYHLEWATHGWHGAYPAIDQALHKTT